MYILVEISVELYPAEDQQAMKKYVFAIRFMVVLKCKTFGC